MSPVAAAAVVAAPLVEAPTEYQIAQARALLARVGDPTPDTSTGPVYHFAAGFHVVFNGK